MFNNILFFRVVFLIFYDVYFKKKHSTNNFDVVQQLHDTVSKNDVLSSFPRAFSFLSP